MAGRIKIEPYKPLDVRTPPVPGGGYINVDASVGKFGASPLLRLFAQPTEGGAESADVAGIVNRLLARDDEAVVKDADARLGEAEQKLLFDPQDGYLNSKGPEAVAQSAVVLDAYTETHQREAETLENDAQRRMLEALAQRRMATFGEQVERHSSAERLRWHDTTSDRRIATMQADAGFNWSDDALLRRALGTVRAEVRDKAERHGWDSLLTEAALRQQTSRTLVSAIEAAVERDPDRARSVRTRYDQHIEAADRAALDTLLTEAQTRQRAQQASAEILNVTPPGGQAPTLQWRLQQAEAIAEPGVRAATVRTLHAAAATVEARARDLAEQVLARVLKDGLTDPSQIPVREWVALDAERRQAIETRLDHNAAGTEPAANPALVDELATQMTQATSAFARRDLVPSVAELPLPQWKRFRDLQAGTRHDDPATADELNAIKRGLQLATRMLPANTPDEEATNYRAELAEEIGTWRRINGKSPDDADIADMLRRRAPDVPHVTRTLEGDPRRQTEFHQLSAGNDSTTYLPNFDRLRRLLEAMIRVEAGRATNEAIRSITKGMPGDTEDVAAVTGLKLADGHPSRIRRNGEEVYFNPKTGRYLVRNRLKGPGYWAEFDAGGEFVGVVGDTLVHSTPRDQLSPEQVEEWTKPETYPADRAPPPFPPPPLPPPEMPTASGTPIAPPAKPPIISTPTPPPAPPPILDRRVKRWNDSEPWEVHHHVPQAWWQHGKPKRIPFSKEAMDLFGEETVEIPKNEHWGDLHKAYNAVAGKALKDYLEKNKKRGETWKDFAGRMTRDEAQKCYEHMIHTILNPPKGLSQKDAEAARDAKEFLENVSEYVSKKKR